MSGAQRIPLIEQLRGLAALSVAWFHLTNQYQDTVSRSGSLGWLGVEVFFVISGFVIPLSLAGQWQRLGFRAVPLFLLRRLARIEPPYLVSVLLVVGLNTLSMTMPGFQGQAQQYPLGQLMLHVAYLIPLSSYEWLQPVYWTLAFEFAFYLVVAGLIGVLAGTRRLPFLLCFALTLAACSLSVVSPLVALFAMGCSAFRAHAGTTGRAHALTLVFAAALVMSALGAWDQALVGAATACLILIPAASGGAGGKLGVYLGRLGAVSYSLYLLHVPIGGRVVNLGRRWLHDELGHLLLSVTALLLSLAAAALFWRLVERPCIAAARELGGRPNPGLNSRDGG